MKMITLFMPEAYLRRADELVEDKRFPNRSEEFRFIIMSYLDKEFGGRAVIAKTVDIQPEEISKEIEMELAKPSEN